MKSLLAFALVALTASSAFAGEKLRAVASFSILGDMAARIGGPAAEVTTIVGPDGDAHVYEPTPADARAFAAADVVVINGLGFEGFQDRLAKASGYQGPVVIASAGVDTFAEDGEADPHAWQDASNARVYAQNIARAFCEADKPRCETYGANAAAYIAELDALHAEAKAAIAAIPEARRTVIMSHDALGYFARAYGLTVLAPEGVSTDSEASAADVAKLVTQIRAAKASALFIENMSDPRLIEQIGRETGLAAGGALYTDALSPPDGPAATYIGMMRHNIRAITGAIAGS